MLLLVAAASVQLAVAITPPNTSLATVPTAYFGGNYDRRGQANIEMLAKMRIVMLEKWEGHCWQDCLDKPLSQACTSSCNVENLILDTHSRIKAINPGVSSILYLNTLLDFPFYTLHGLFKEANALTIDNTTNLPVVIRNDNGMEGIYVFGFDTEAGQNLYINAIKNYTSTGLIDGFFGDKFDKAATLSQNAMGGQWQLCNHECGNVSASVAARWNAGKAKVVTAVNEFLGNQGPWFANGNAFAGIPSNFHGSWNFDQLLHSGDPRKLVEWVQGEQCMSNHTFCYLSSTSDQHWTTDPNDPSSLISACDTQCLGRFLLAVEEGVFLGTNGWDEQYYYPLGGPRGPAVFAPASSNAPATLTRKFASNTSVVFTYNANTSDGTSVIYWEGRPPPPPPAPPSPIVCGGCGSSVLVGTTFAMDDVAPALANASIPECCAACAALADCVQWSLHGASIEIAITRESDFESESWSRPPAPNGRTGCHLHGAGATSKAQTGTVSGVLKRTAV